MHKYFIAICYLLFLNLFLFFFNGYLATEIHNIISALTEDELINLTKNLIILRFEKHKNNFIKI